MIPDLTTIQQAHQRIAAWVHRTPILSCKTINQLVNAELYFKCENFQKVGAFKYRGATNAVLCLSDIEKVNGVITHSSGNHAQALALAAQTHNISAHIVMPENAPQVKVNGVRSYQGKIHFCSPSLTEREKTMQAVQAENGAFEIHPYNNYRVIAGQATAAKELIEDLPFPLDTIMAPVGGGGLLSGTALSTHFLSPETKTIAAEPLQANDAYRSFKARKQILQTHPNTIADGLRTSLGDKTFPLILKYVNDIFTATEESIVQAMYLIWERMKIIVEPSAAVPLATILEKKRTFEGQKIGIILSGGNVDLNHLPWH